jgi:hypothetical protein
MEDKEIVEYFGGKRNFQKVHLKKGAVKGK